MKEMLSLAGLPDFVVLPRINDQLGLPEALQRARYICSEVSNGTLKSFSPERNRVEMDCPAPLVGRLEPGAPTAR